MRCLLLNQAFPPDAAASGRQLADVARGLAARGHEVTVITSRRGYDDPRERFPKEERWRGVRVLRVGATGFGKGARWRRAGDFLSFLALCSARALTLPKCDLVLALTSPPLISVPGAAVAGLHRARFVYWVMDLNPDEAIAAGWLRGGSLAARLLESLSRLSLRSAGTVIALDRFMRERLLAKGVAPGKIAVIPPWAQTAEVVFDSAGRERFRRAHGLEKKFVVMYSGNHSPCHPLDTLLEAAKRLRNERGIVFCFVGGGSEWRRIRAREARKNVRCIPYQPFEELSGSLSAADLHVVSMGNDFVGVVHPCKIYNLLGIGARVLYVGPTPSAITEILNEVPRAICVRHGEVERVVECILKTRAEGWAPSAGLATRLCDRFSRENLLPQMLDLLEGARADLPRLIPAKI